MKVSCQNESELQKNSLILQMDELYRIIGFFSSLHNLILLTFRHEFVETITNAHTKKRAMLIPRIVKDVNYVVNCVDEVEIAAMKTYVVYGASVLIL